MRRRREIYVRSLLHEEDSEEKREMIIISRTNKDIYIVHRKRERDHEKTLNER